MKSQLLILAVVACALSSCGIPESKAVAAHAAGELALVPSGAPYGAAGAPSVGAQGKTPESDKADAFWGRKTR